MNNFARYITPSEYLKIADNSEHRTLEELKKAAMDESMCEVCEAEKVWKLAGVGMCFTCTTGEVDASEDLELKPEESSEWIAGVSNAALNRAKNRGRRE